MVLPTRCNDQSRTHLRVMGDLGQVRRSAPFPPASPFALCHPLRRRGPPPRLPWNNLSPRNP